MRLIIYIHYLLLFFKNDNLKYTTASQRLTFNSFLLFHIFYLFVFFLIISFQNSYAQKKHHVCNLYRISYTLRVFTMYYIVPEICIGGYFLEDCFYCYSQQLQSAVANESLIPYNLI